MLSTRPTLTVALLVIATLLPLGCSDDSSVPVAPELEDTGTFASTPKPIGDGTVHTWAELDSGMPVRIGVTLSEDALAGLPGTTQMLAIPLPAEARAATLFDHVLFDWNPIGHPPGGIYSVPHFDFHFYTIPSAARAAIPYGPATDRTPVAAQFIPRDYIPIEGLVGGMGGHWADSTSAEFEGAFDRTLIYVSYEGRIVAIEPMITREHLALRRDETIPIRQPEAYQRAGYYPMSYRIRYDEATREYHVTLEAFVERAGA